MIITKSACQARNFIFAPPHRIVSPVFIHRHLDKSAEIDIIAILTYHGHLARGIFPDSSIGRASPDRSGLTAQVGWVGKVK
ncbi:MAG: hypothetical protein JW837_19395, partial [Sedimentisphaerales bacterium]|nr:hypothetical protein [Sedimentisphaerales bacterium]